MNTEKLQRAATGQWEWDGNFAKAAGHGAQFALYLALQSGASVGQLRIQPAPTETAQSAYDIAQLNHYRRPSLSARPSDMPQSARLASFMTQGDVVSARLHGAMHPQPLSFHNDVGRIPDDVLANCSLATQRRLQGEQAVQLDEDNTRLDDIIAQANDYMVA